MSRSRRKPSRSSCRPSAAPLGPLASDSVTVELSVVTILPKASSTSTVTGVSVVPAVVLVGVVANASCAGELVRLEPLEPPLVVPPDAGGVPVPAAQPVI